MYAFVGLGVGLKNFLLVAAALFTAGLSEGNVTIAQSAASDLTPPHKRSRYFGYIFFSASLSYVFGPLLGGSFALISFSIPFYVVSILLLFVLVWIFASFKETLSDHKKVHISYFEAFTNLKNIVLMPKIRYMFFVNFVLYLAIFGYLQGFPLFIVKEFNVGVHRLSIFIAWTAIPFLVVNLWLVGFFSKRFTSKQIVIGSAFLTAIFLEILLLPKSEGALWITLLLAGLPVALCLLTSAAMLSTSVGEKEQGRVMGNNQSLQFFAEAISGLAMGFLASFFVELALMIFGALSLCGALMLLLKKRLR